MELWAIFLTFGKGKAVTMASSKEPVGDFYVHVLNRGAGLAPNTRPQLVSSTKLLTQQGKPTVIHFYDGG